MRPIFSYRALEYLTYLAQSCARRGSLTLDVKIYRSMEQETQCMQIAAILDMSTFSPTWSALQGGGRFAHESDTGSGNPVKTGGQSPMLAAVCRRQADAPRCGLFHSLREESPSSCGSLVSQGTPTAAFGSIGRAAASVPVRGKLARPTPPPSCSPCTESLD